MLTENPKNICVGMKNVLCALPKISHSLRVLYSLQTPKRQIWAQVLYILDMALVSFFSNKIHIASLIIYFETDFQKQCYNIKSVI